MGYRSDVMALFYNIVTGDEAKDKRGVATLDMFVRENFPEALKGSAETSLDDGLRRVVSGTRVVWEFRNSNVKWYESYDDIKAFDAFWDKFCDLADNSQEGDDPVDWACEFYRIGEDTDDIEGRSSNEAEWLMSVSRVIDTNY